MSGNKQSNFINELQKVSPLVNEENIINDTIFELIEESDIDKLFRLYNKIKNQIPPGVIQRNTEDKISILNEAEYKTHAYLVANSKNYLTGESYLYSIDEVNALLIQLDVLKSRLIELNSQLTVTLKVIESFGGVIQGTTGTVTQFLQSADNIEKYSTALINFYMSLNNFTTENIENIVNGLQVEYNTASLSTFEDKVRMG